jgi:hypothetical protein
MKQQHINDWLRAFASHEMQRLEHHKPNFLNISERFTVKTIGNIFSRFVKYADYGCLRQ